MKKLLRTGMLFASIVIAQCIMAQSGPQVTGVKADDVWNIVYKVLNENNLAVVTSNLPVSVETDFKEYSAGLFKNRAKLVFTYQNENLTITLKNRQTVSSNAWADAMIPSKKADDKLIAGFSDKIKAIAANPEEVAKIKKEGVVSTAVATASVNTPGRNSGTAQVSSTNAAKPPSTANAKEVRFDNMDNYIFTEGLCALKKNDLWGFIDTVGNVVIDFKYFSWLGFKNPKFSSGIAMIGTANAQGMDRHPIFIDKTGQQLFKTQKFTGATNFESGLAIVEKTSSTLARSFHFINKQGVDIPGAINFGAIFGSLPALEPFHEGLTKLYDFKTSSYGFINPQGKWVIMPSNYAEAGTFSEGLVMVQNKVNWTWGYINTKGEVKIPFDYKSKPGNFSDGLAVAMNSKEELGYIDPSGKTALPFIYNHYQLNSEFRNGCAVVYNDNGGGYAIIDKTGKIVRKLNTTVVKVLNNGWILWKEDLGTNASYGFGVLTPDGKDILAPGYFREIGDFSNGLAYATAMIDNKEIKGFINTKFDFVIIQTY
jgi:hypothetical protein